MDNFWVRLFVYSLPLTSWFAARGIVWVWHRVEDYRYNRQMRRWNRESREFLRKAGWREMP